MTTFNGVNLELKLDWHTHFDAFVMSKTKEASPHFLIQTENLSHTFALKHGDVHALKQINLNIAFGQTLAIMGPSGSGKSTLLNLIGCLERPSKGHYWFNHQDVHQLNDEKLASLRATQIGFVFQSFNLIPHLNVLENVQVPFSYRHPPLPPKIVKEKTLSAIANVKLDHRLNHLPCQLSGGECQRVAIARALAIGPLLILADEPTGNLDRETGKTILQIFQELNDRQNITLVIATHDQYVADHCEKILHMYDGAIS